MKKLAIISEYNPFHNGHNYIQKKAKEISGADIIITIMSGDFVQRGELSIIDKYKRANSALNSADLVIEMPSFISLQSANLFAKKNIEILDKIKIDYLAFGIENLEEYEFYNCVEKIFKNKDKIDKKIKTFLEEGLSYTKASYEASKKYIKNDKFFSSNNILALEYMRAIKNLNSNIKVVPIKRLKTMNKDKNLRIDKFASSTAIRNNIYNKNIRNFLPSLSYTYLEKFLDEYKYFPTNEYIYILFRYKLLIEEKNMKDILCYEEGMDNYLKKIAKEEISYDKFIEKSVSMRFTKSKVKRLMINYILDNKTSLNNIDINFIKVLAFNQKAIYIFKEKNIDIIIQKKDSKKLNKENKLIYEKMIMASNLYSLSIGREFDSDFRKKISIEKSSD